MSARDLLANARERIAALDTENTSEWEGAMIDLSEWAADDLGKLLDEYEALLAIADAAREMRRNYKTGHDLDDALARFDFGNAS